tara:strand:+ start:3648 stop:3938 length:291 start_codon:yes stop_codon:yes gene_type:complete
MSTDINSKLTARLVINVKHDGGVLPVTQGELMEVIKESVQHVFTEEDDGLQVKVTYLCTDYTYRDNLEDLRTKAATLLEGADPETINEIIERLQNE